MASNGPVDLQHQKASVAARLRTLVNNDLKEICKAYGRLVSGTKTVLQTRCMEELNEIVHSGDAGRFQEFSYRVANHGLAPSKGSPAVDGFSSQVPRFSTSAMSSAGRHSEQSLSRSSSKTITFKPSPFYELVETLLPPLALPEMRQNRHTVKANLTIGPETAQQLRTDRNLRIMMYCCSPSEGRHNATIAFPSQIEVKINDQDVKANFKGLKNKPGSTKPADVTSFVRRFNGQQNSIQVTYALTTREYAFTIHLERYVSPSQLTEKIKKARVIPRKQVVDDMYRANADPDIAATSIRMSLKDPISTLRITLPVRSSFCKHNQCFDGQFFMELQDQAPQWACPVCSKLVTFESLCIDKYFEDILLNTPKSTQQVDIEPNGDWRVIKEEEDDDQQNGSSRNDRAAYDDDFDEDLVDLDTPPPRMSGHANGSVTVPNISLSSPAGQGAPAHAPSRDPSTSVPASANRPSNKRPSSTVIDLTFSDDEDEEDEQPPRPAKRQQVTNNSSFQGNSGANGSNNTSTNLPDRRFPTHSASFSSAAGAAGVSNSSPGPSNIRLPSINHAVGPSSLPPPTNLYHSPSPQLNPAFRSSPYTQAGWQGQSAPQQQQQQQQQVGSTFASRSPVSIRPPLPPPPLQQQQQSSFNFLSGNGTGSGGGGGFGTSGSQQDQPGSSRFGTPAHQQQQQQQQQSSSSQQWGSHDNIWSHDYNGFSSQSPPE